MYFLAETMHSVRYFHNIFLFIQVLLAEDCIQDQEVLHNICAYQKIHNISPSPLEAQVVTYYTPANMRYQTSRHSAILITTTCHALFAKLPVVALC